MELKQFNKEGKIALVIPCFNEEYRLQIKDLNFFIYNNKHWIDFYFVDDGSSDSTSNIIKNLLIKNNPESIFLLRLAENQGKGNAVREGILFATQREYNYYGFIDGDMEIPFEQVLKLHAAISDTNKSLAISVRSLNKKINFYKPRTVISVLIVIIANSIIKFKIPIKDSQCGCKLFRSNIIEICFKDKFQTHWLFDLEIFLRLRNGALNPREEIQEVPLNNLNDVKNSTIKLTRNLKILKQLWAINSYYNK